MNRKATIVSVVLACILVVSAGAAVLLRPHRVVNINALVVPQPVTELKHPETMEYLEKRFPDLMGQTTRTEVTFRNGHQGERIFNEMQKLLEVRIWDELGRTYTHMKYAEDGVQPLQGFERRQDGSLRRVVEVVDGWIVATYYWQDGVTPFAVIRRQMAEGQPFYRWWNHREYVSTFFHANGKLWARQTSTYVNHDTVTLSEEVFDPEGRLVKSISRDVEGSSVFSYFSADGTPTYKQVVGIYQIVTPGGNEDGSDSVVKARVLRELHLFDSRGELVCVVHFDEQGKQIVRIDNIRGDDVVRPNDFVMESAWGIWSDEPADPMATWRKADGENITR